MGQKLFGLLSFLKRLKSSIFNFSLDPPQQTKIIQIIYHGKIKSTNFTTKKQRGFSWFRRLCATLL